MDQLVSEASSTTSTTDVTSSDGLRVLSFDTFQHALSHALRSSRTVRCCCELVAAHATGACRRLLCHAGSIAVQLAAGAGATERHRERARDRLRRRTWTVLREPTCGRSRQPQGERARLRDGASVASAPGTERMQAEAVRGGDVAMRDGHARMTCVDGRVWPSSAYSTTSVLCVNVRVYAPTEVDVCINRPHVVVLQVCSARDAAGALAGWRAVENTDLCKHEG